MNKLLLILLFFPMISFAQSADDELRWTIIPVANAPVLFDQCSRGAPEYVEIIETDMENYKKAIALLIEKKEVVERKIDNKMGKYTYQLAAYRLKSKKEKFIYFSCGLTNKHLETEKKWEENPIITCDQSTMYWGIVYDIRNHELIWFKTNGPLWRQADKL